MHEGDLLIDSGARACRRRPELGVGERTRRITTVTPAATRPTTREHTGESRAAGRRITGLSRASPMTTPSGPHAHDVCKDSVTIGRGGIAYPVDIRIASAVDVSREHARIRRDPKTARFYLIDLSSLGTTLNGRHVPRGYEEHEGAKRENGVETPLPDTAGSVWPTSCFSTSRRPTDGACSSGPVSPAGRARGSRRRLRVGRD
jgi:hypothetical protein